MPISFVGKTTPSSISAPVPRQRRGAPGWYRSRGPRGPGAPARRQRGLRARGGDNADRALHGAALPGRGLRPPPPVSADAWFEANRRRWDERVPIHYRSSFYDVAGFLAGASSLEPHELAEVGDVGGKSLLHLQCHFGLDTLSWARLGARVTGLDFSGEGIRAARELAAEADISAEFVGSEPLRRPRSARRSRLRHRLHRQGCAHLAPRPRPLGRGRRRPARARRPLLPPRHAPRRLSVRRARTCARPGFPLLPRFLSPGAGMSPAATPIQTRPPAITRATSGPTRSVRSSRLSRAPASWSSPSTSSTTPCTGRSRSCDAKGGSGSYRRAARTFRSCSRFARGSLSERAPSSELQGPPTPTWLGAPSAHQGPVPRHRRGAPGWYRSRGPRGPGAPVRRHRGPREEVRGQC